MSKIQGILVDGSSITRHEVEDSLDAFEELVEGNYGDVHLGFRFVAVLNDDGMLLGLPKNILGIYGKAFVAKVDENGKIVSLTSEEQAWAMNEFIRDLT